MESYLGFWGTYLYIHSYRFIIKTELYPGMFDEHQQQQPLILADANANNRSSIIAGLVVAAHYWHPARAIGDSLLVPQQEPYPFLGHN